MNAKFHKLSQCSSQQNFSIPYYYPLSPFQKIATPHRVRVTSTPSGQASPITFLTAANRDKSPAVKENEGVSLNQSPITNRFSSKQTDLGNDKRKSPIGNMTKKLGSRVSHHTYHKSDPAQPVQQSIEVNNSSCRNFEESLRSLTSLSPKVLIKNKQNISKVKVSNNFKGILEAQQYQIKQRDIENRKQGPLLKKSYSINQYDKKLFSSCFQNSEKRMMNQTLEKKSNSMLFCMNNDGNTAKYITIACQDDDERLYYCSKCTVLLVNQGFVLQEIVNQASVQQSVDPDAFMDVSNKIEDCKDKLSSLINDLSMREEFELGKISQFYDGLISLVEKCKSNSQLKIGAIYKQKIEEYQSILLQVDKFGQNIQETQENLQQFYQLHQQILKFSMGEPLLKKYDSEQLERLQESFSQAMAQQFSLISLPKTAPSKDPQVHQGIINRNHGLRFSFQKLLHDISSKKSKMQNIITSLQEQQQEEDSDCVQVEGEMNQKAAFRDLFPQGEDICQINSGVNSPTFKHF